MGKNLKIIAGFMVTVSVIAAATLLIVRYFDVLMKLYDTLRDTIAGKKTGFFSEECCDCCIDDDDLEEDILITDEI